MSETVSRFNDDAMRVFAILAAGILLNWGLFFILTLITPLVVGIICGYILVHQRNAIIAGTLSAAFSYALLFIATGSASDLIVFSEAVLIMVIFGGVGGFIGSVLYKRMSKSSYQVSTTIRPGE
ncbi:MAG: hypothetical protein KAR03_06595 [Candidatus Thorarchaeota archaeon]|nr:hypothetical protein [Candidatus Thorarchaeota archaeon]